VTVWVPSYPDGVDQSSVGELLGGLPRLRVLQLLSAGVEPWPRLVPPGVTLCSGRSIHGASTAELAVAGLLALVRELPRYLAQQRLGSWAPHRPRSVAGRRVLVLGAGDIGQRVAAALGALDAEVLLVARRPRAGVLTLPQVPELLPTVDAVVVALPHTDETAGLVDSAFLASLPDGAAVVNVARGAIVDTAALTAEVSAGRLLAALDVTDPEPLPTDHPLWGLPGALLTPHVGGGATGWEVRAQRLLTEQLSRLRAGGELLNVVTHGY
jgi:phosphoglycerate dehydrogenase-like enzyme